MIDTRAVWHNPKARTWTAPLPDHDHALVSRFHQSFPEYAVTPIISLPNLANELNLGRVLVKDESNRCGLPSFKVLGASWGAVSALSDAPAFLTSGFDTMVTAASERTFYAATDGNHGRAVARFCRVTGAKAKIFVPEGMDDTTADLIRNEGAQVIYTHVPYDEAVRRAHVEAEQDQAGVLVQDTAFEGYEKTPQRIVDGYSTLLHEIDEQLGGMSPDLIVTPVGVGSLAQAVVLHSKAKGRSTKVLAVEPETSACLWHSLREGKPMSIKTCRTIMAGMDCGSVSTIAWPALSNGVDAALTLSDHEAHRETKWLETQGVHAGPCGAATVASLRRLSPDDCRLLSLGPRSTVVVLCTEGTRHYEAPAES